MPTARRTLLLGIAKTSRFVLWLQKYTYLCGVVVVTPQLKQFGLGQRHVDSPKRVGNWLMAIVMLCQVIRFQCSCGVDGGLSFSWFVIVPTMET